MSLDVTGRQRQGLPSLTIETAGMADLTSTIERSCSFTTACHVLRRGPHPARWLSRAVTIRRYDHPARSQYCTIAGRRGGTMMVRRLLNVRVTKHGPCWHRMKPWPGNFSLFPPTLLFDDRIDFQRSAVEAETVPTRRWGLAVTRCAIVGAAAIAVVAVVDSVVNAEPVRALPITEDSTVVGRVMIPLTGDIQRDAACLQTGGNQQHHNFRVIAGGRHACVVRFGVAVISVKAPPQKPSYPLRSNSDVLVDALRKSFPIVNNVVNNGNSHTNGSLMNLWTLIRLPFDALHGVFCFTSLVVLLALLAAVPIFQLIAFGYLLNVGGQLARGTTLREALPQVRQAGQIGLTIIVVMLAGLPIHLLTHWEAVATLIEPGSIQSSVLRGLAIGVSMLTMIFLLWAWARGGRLVHYLWPQPLRFLSEGWRWRTWSSLPDRLWAFTASLELRKYFWLGLRGMLGTIVWLIPAFIIIAAFRVGETGLAGFVGFTALVMLGISLLYLPMLQVHFAAENRLGALFEVDQVRQYFRRAPWAWLMAMVVALILTPIPLYLLKIEATPREAVWLLTLIFVAFILPARVATGLAIRRARRKRESSSWWASCSRWLVRMMMPAVVGIYVLFVYVSQYTSWDGLATWVQQHAVLIPVPFLDGV